MSDRKAGEEDEVRGDGGPPSAEVVRVLADNHRRFLAFLERRVRSREVAEDLLQEAFVRSLDKADSIEDTRTVVAWFYRVLRNALVDHYRRGGVEQRLFAAGGEGPEPVDPATEDPELFAEVCRCAGELVETLKPEYAAAVRRVDLDGLSVGEYAREARITANNAGVRLHRAHRALRKQVALSCGTCATHGCLDCSCRK